MPTLEIPPPPKQCPRCGSRVNTNLSVLGATIRDTATCQWRHQLYFDRATGVWAVRG